MPTTYHLNPNAVRPLQSSSHLPEGLVRVYFTGGVKMGETLILAEEYAAPLLRKGIAERSKDQTKR